MSVTSIKIVFNFWLLARPHGSAWQTSTQRAGILIPKPVDANHIELSFINPNRSACLNADQDPVITIAVVPSLPGSAHEVPCSQPFVAPSDSVHEVPCGAGLCQGWSTA